MSEVVVVDNTKNIVIFLVELLVVRTRRIVRYEMKKYILIVMEMTDAKIIIIVLLE